MKAHPTLKDVGVALTLLLLSAAARAQQELWVSSETVNDPEKEKLCKERAAKENQTGVHDPRQFPLTH